MPCQQDTDSPLEGQELLEVAVTIRTAVLTRNNNSANLGGILAGICTINHTLAGLCSRVPAIELAQANARCCSSRAKICGGEDHQ